MQTDSGSALWRQFGAAIAALETALKACPEELWVSRVWPEPPPSYFPRQFSEFWYVTYHTLVWLDIYLQGVPESDFAPPAPFAQGELDSPGAVPDRPYTREQLLDYLASLRGKARRTLTALSDEETRRPVEYGWSGGQQVPYLELVLYNMRHVQEHAAQLSLFLGQHGVPGEELEYPTRAGGDAVD